MEQDKTFANYCKEFDTKVNRLVNIIYGLLTLFIAGSLALFVTFGELKAQTNEIERKVEFVWKDYMPSMYLEGFAKNQNYQTQEIVATIKGDKEAVKEINAKYIDFQKTMLDNMIKARGGVTNNVRGVKK
jgi:tetrahydromethanopterin S-methyltransferase subunit G